MINRLERLVSRLTKTRLAKQSLKICNMINLVDSNKVYYKAIIHII